MNRHCAALLGFSVVCGSLPPAGAAAVHKWVDENGLTHYSDEPPDSIETTLIELPEPTLVSTAGEDGSPADDYYSIQNQWQRMNQERLERERLNLERAKIRAEQQTPAPAPAIVKYDAVRYVPIYSGYRFKRYHRRHYRKHDRYHGGMRPQSWPSAPSGLGTFPTQ